MVDLGDKGSDCEDIIRKDETLNQAPKTCADCGTTKTPLWRGGPAGPKSLCNACGIRSRKKRRALMSLSNNKEDKKAKKTNNSNNSTVTTSDGSSNSEEDVNDKVGISVKRKEDCLESENALQRPRSSVSLQRPRSSVSLQRPRSILSKKRKKLGEEEQAAMLLMALSCGSVFA